MVASCTMSQTSRQHCFSRLQIDSAYKPKNLDGSWVTTYHQRLYNLTDEAARGAARTCVHMRARCGRAT
jgi:hypothetical protein